MISCLTLLKKRNQVTDSVVFVSPAPAEVQEQAPEAVEAVPEAPAAAPGTVLLPVTLKLTTEKHQIPCLKAVTLG